MSIIKIERRVLEKNDALAQKNRALLKRYNQKINFLKNAIFLGRLARFKYLNMDQVVEESLDAFDAQVSVEFCGPRDLCRYG